MNPVTLLVKKIFLKAGFTVLRGDIRKKIHHNAGCPSLPSHLLKNSQVAASRNSVLQQFPPGGTVVEVGVAYGGFTEILLDELKPDRFIAIDTFAISHGDEPWGQTTLKDNNISHFNYYCQRFQEQIASGKMETRQGLSWEMLAQLPDQSVDYMYVDADHSYESVKKDINALKNKMKSGGIIQFNDYSFFDQNALLPYGVPRAVNEFMIENNFEMLFFCLHPEGFYDVVVRKVLGVEC
jgi:hypothetical protein